MLGRALALFALLAMFRICGPALGAAIELRLPPETKARSAIAEATAVKVQTDGRIDGQTVKFDNLLPDTPYDIRVTLSDGAILQGVDMAWYNSEPPKPNVEPMDDENRKQIDELFNGVKGFENKRNMLLIRGDRDRAVILAELIRDTAFHSDSGGEIIWRIELWYYKNQHGGWERVAQQNKVLRRERFTTKAQFDEVQRIRWTQDLGGVKLKADETKVINLAGPTTRPK